MQSPIAVFIGDSIIAGHPANCSFIDPYGANCTGTNLASDDRGSIWHFNRLYVSDMGIGSQTTTVIAARFTSDAVNLNPNIVVIEGGVNDLVGGSITESTFLANWTNMLASAQANPTQQRSWS